MDNFVQMYNRVRIGRGSSCFCLRLEWMQRKWLHESGHQRQAKAGEEGRGARASGEPAQAPSASCSRKPAPPPRSPAHPALTPPHPGGRLLFPNPLNKASQPPTQQPQKKPPTPFPTPHQHPSTPPHTQHCFSSKPALLPKFHDIQPLLYSPRLCPQARLWGDTAAPSWTSWLLSARNRLRNQNFT